VEDEIGADAIEERARGGGIGQVRLGRARRDDVRGAAGPERLDDVRAEEAAAAGHEDPLLGQVEGHRAGAVLP
jgi:hypothetical protein